LVNPLSFKALSENDWARVKLCISRAKDAEDEQVGDKALAGLSDISRQELEDAASHWMNHTVCAHLRTAITSGAATGSVGSLDMSTLVLEDLEVT
jgi:hypothetical protein